MPEYEQRGGKIEENRLKIQYFINYNLQISWGQIWFQDLIMKWRGATSREPESDINSFLTKIA